MSVGGIIHINEGYEEPRTATTNKKKPQEMDEKCIMR
jgi:hypothetical protein